MVACAAAAAAAAHLMHATNILAAFGSNRKSQGFPIKQLPDGARPNFIVILTDDLGRDDVGINNPKYARTPNLNR
jgi:hypothetical protein